MGHDVAHAAVPSLRQPNVHVIIDGCPQAPDPLHAAALVSVPFAHEAALPHVVVLPGNTHVRRFCVVPSHRPAHVPLPAQAVRGVVTGTHVPALPVALHDSHWPSHATSQQ